jgi:TRAP-type C4-dicarboxylate transport system substrate-binding protein
MDELETAVKAYRQIFDKRIEQRFGAKVLAIWPFGPQVFFCNQPIRTLDDLKGLRVRSFTPSMSKLIESLGATPVSISFPEVYPSLQRAVANCGVTSPTSANTGRWPEVTTHILPLSVSGSVQAHLVNAAWFDKLSAPQREALARETLKMEQDLWALARSTNEDATNCSTGREPCAGTVHGKYKLTLVDVAPADLERVRKLSQEVVLGEWAGRCERAYTNCKAAWNDTIGKARGLTIQ